MAITIVLTLVFSLTFVLAGPVSASPIGWNVSGTWQVNVIYNSVTYPETLSLTQSGSAITGVYIDTIPPGSYFTITTGSVSSNHVIIDGVQGGLTVELVGDIANNGSMGGTWSDIVGGSRTGTWQSSSGNATPIFAPIYSSGSVIVTGEMVAPTITLSAPSPFAFPQFVEGVNTTNSGAGNVTFNPGSDQFAKWTLSATSSGGYILGEMYCSALSNMLATPMQVSLDNVNWGNLPTGVTTAPSIVTNSTFYVYAYQVVTQADILIGSGTYTMTIDLMASVTP
jgi:hypothetical protein